MPHELMAEPAQLSTKQPETIDRRPTCELSTRTGIHPLLQLQRTIGNRRVAQLIQARRLTPQGTILPVQPKLTVGAADEEYEREADRVAKQVMAMPPPDVRSAAPPTRDTLQSDEVDGSGGKLTAARITPLRQQPIQSESEGSGRESFEADASVETQLSSTKQSGSPLQEEVRGFMEPRFGVDLSEVRVHTGSNAVTMNRAVGAKAFAHGADIYFGAGTTPNDLELTAHELTHVVQQTGARQTAPLRRTCEACNTGHTQCPKCVDEKDRAQIRREVEGGNNALPHIGFLAPAEILILQRTLGNRGKRRLLARGAQGSPILRRDADDAAAGKRRMAHAKTEMLDVATLTEQETKSTNLPALLLPRISPPQVGNEKQAANELDVLAPVFESAVREFANARATAFQIRESLGEAKKEAVQARNPDYAGGPREPLLKAAKAARELSRELEIVNRGIDAGDLVKNGATLAANVASLSPSANSDAIAAVWNAAENFRKRVVEASQQAPDLAGAARRVSFVLHYFVALNTPDFAGAPAKDEAGAMLGKIDNLGPDLESLFGPGSAFSLSFFGELAKNINHQLGVRQDMKTVTGNETELVQSKATVLSYFHTLAKKKNPVVISAYENYAKAYFQHRIVVKIEDFDVTGLEDIFARPLSLAGTRPLVCTGYAVLGQKLLGEAGASFKEFMVAIRASREQLRAQKFDEGHAVAVLRREGAALYVSNDSIVGDEDHAIGPDAVAWDHPEFPGMVGKGASLHAAIGSLQQQLAAGARH